MGQRRFLCLSFSSAQRRKGQNEREKAPEDGKIDRISDASTLPVSHLYILLSLPTRTVYHFPLFALGVSSNSSFKTVFYTCLHLRLDLESFNGRARPEDRPKAKIAEQERKAKAKDDLEEQGKGGERKAEKLEERKRGRIWLQEAFLFNLAFTPSSFYGHVSTFSWKENISEGDNFSELYHSFCCRVT